MSNGGGTLYRIRRARLGDLAALPAIEREAGRLFEGLALGSRIEEDETSAEDFEQSLRSELLFVAADAEDQPVGFACVEILDGGAHLDELDVHPDHARRGLGAALVQAVCDWAARQGHASVTLTTFRDIPWNRPFYEKLGFVVVPAEELPEALSELVDEEQSIRGLLTSERVVMRYAIRD